MMRSFAKWFMISAIIAVLFMCGMAQAEIASGTDGNISWSLSDEGVLTIDGTGAMPYYNNAVAPWLSKRDSITSVLVKEGITNIGFGAF